MGATPRRDFGGLKARIAETKFCRPGASARQDARAGTCADTGTSIGLVMVLGKVFNLLLGHGRDSMHIGILVAHEVHPVQAKCDRL